MISNSDRKFTFFSTDFKILLSKKCLLCKTSMYELNYGLFEQSNMPSTLDFSPRPDKQARKQEPKSLQS